MRLRAQYFLSAVAMGAAFLACAALAGTVVPPSDLDKFADPESFVLAIRTEFPAAGGAVRVSVYDNADAFLEEAALKQAATIDETGVALLKLRDLSPGPYAFVAYYDANGDGQLNRGGVLGKPQEPYAFSNGVKPKLRKPRFDEAAVDVAPGAVVLLTLEE